ncbi:MAG: sulfatase, partial [Acidobacteria bacterium]|nr:sulfatase [Acidobacteriota bacterium]
MMISRRGFLTGAAAYPLAAGAAERRPPNLVIIFADDQGYGDLGAYGAQNIRTPHVDRMAQEGVRFTSFYVAAGVCTPSRAALLTGCYPMRLGLGHRVLFPYSTTGLNPDEITLAEILRGRGYATGCIGKWHLGHHPKFLPTRQGFDYYLGVPYSNDMGGVNYKAQNFQAPPLPLLRGEEQIEEAPDQRYFTRRYTEDALHFLATNKDRPFFLYLAHHMPHLPLAASEKFQGKSAHGLYGDVIEELDWSIGQILARLRKLGLDENTLVMFSSDNGPVIRPGLRGGSAGPLRGSKNTTWEGGHRVPCIMRWPGRIPRGRVCHALVTAMDILPSFARLAGASPPADRIIDGRDIRPLILGERGARSPHEAFYYYRDERLQAVRSGRWKLHVYRPEWETDGAARRAGPLL